MRTKRAMATSDAAPIYFPGASFFAAALLTFGCVLVVAHAFFARRTELAVESPTA